MNNNKYILVTNSLCPSMRKIRSIRTLKVLSQILQHFFNSKDGSFTTNLYLSQSQLSSETRLDPAAISRAIKELKEVGIIEKYIPGCIVLNSNIFSKPIGDLPCSTFHTSHT